MPQRQRLTITPKALSSLILDYMLQQGNLGVNLAFYSLPILPPRLSIQLSTAIDR